MKIYENIFSYCRYNKTILLISGTNMIRKSTLNFNSSNSGKLEILSQVFNEYNRIVNIIIQFLWKEKTFHDDFVANIPETQTWFSKRLQQCAARQALSIVKSQRKKKSMPQFNS